MGYYTCFELSWERHGATEDQDILDQAIPCYVDRHKELRHALGLDHEKARWYTWEQDMLELSQAFPGVLFALQGKGEDTHDLWRAYFLDGKIQRAAAEITFPEFDPLLLE